MGTFKNKFDSNRQDWTTPKELFNKLNEEFNFEWDLAASKENTLCTKFFTIDNNGLNQKWEGTCYLNPPFNTKNCRVIDWVKKAYLDTQNDSNLTVVMLLPARTNNKFWHQYIMKASEIKFICGRVKFGDNKHGLPLPIAIVIFKLTTELTKFSSFYL